MSRGLLKKLHYVKQNTEEMKQTPDYHENMEDRMEELLTNGKENDTDGIKYSARKQKDTAAHTEHLKGFSDTDQDAPAHPEITDHRQDFELLQIDRVERNAQSGNAPDEAEDCPSQPRLIGTDRTKGDRRIGACDQEINRTVVKNLEDLFSLQL